MRAVASTYTVAEKLSIIAAKAAKRDGGDIIAPEAKSGDTFKKVENVKVEAKSS